MRLGALGTGWPIRRGIQAGGSDGEYRALPAGAISPAARSDGTDPLHSPLGPYIRRVHEKYHAADEAEGMAKQEVLYLTVVATPPVRPSQEGPADLSLVQVRIVGMEAGRTDDLSGARLTSDQRTTRG